MSHVIGIDVGSQSIKGVLLDGTGAIVATGSAPLDMVHPANGWAEQDPESFTVGLADVIGQLRTRCPAASVGVLWLACQACGVVALGSSGQALLPAKSILAPFGRHFGESLIGFEPSLDALGQRDFFGAIDQGHLADLAQVEPDRVARTPRLARR